MTKLVNCTKALVEEELEKYLAGKKDKVCTCERCMLDMRAYALNHSKPKYIVSETGYIYQKISEMMVQNNVDILRVVVDAVEKVSKNPNH